MRRLLQFVFLLFAASAFAQSPPPAGFTGLLTGYAVITGCQVNGSNTAILTTSSNTLQAGKPVTIAGLTACSFLNYYLNSGYPLIVSATGLSNTGFQVPFTHSAVSFVSDSGFGQDATDYTCAGVVPCSTWPMPANPGKGSSYTDPNWGTTTWEMQVSSSNTGGNVIPIYSRNQGFSSDNKHLLMSEVSAEAVDLYDATTVPPTPINRITTSDGTLISPTGGDAYWANTQPNIIYYIPWGYAYDPTSPCSGGVNCWAQLRSLDISTCTTSSCVLTPTLVHDFAASGPPCVSDQYTSPSGGDPALIPYAAITNVTILSGTITLVTTSNTFTTTAHTNIAYLEGFTGGLASLNGTMVTVTSSTSTSLVGTISAGNVTSTAVSGAYAGAPGNVIESSYTGSQGQMFDITDTYFTFGCDRTGYATDIGNAANIDVLRYNKSTNTVTTQLKWYSAMCTGGVPNGCGTFNPGTGQNTYSRPGYNMYRMAQHPNANYITVEFLCESEIEYWSVGCGSAAYGPTWNSLGPLSSYDFHMDNGYDVNSVPISLFIGYSTGASGDKSQYYSLELINLTTLNPTAITSKELVMPCTWAYAGLPCPTNPYLEWKQNHISLTGTWGSSTISGVPGYALMSTFIQAGSSSFNPDFPANTTIGTAVTSTGVNTVTPASMANIGVGTTQLIDCGTIAGGGCSPYPNAESVIVTAVTSTTFTANFTKTHTSSAPVVNLSVGDTGWGAMENIAFKIDTTCTAPCPMQFWRLGRTMTIRDNDYTAEAHAFVNRDWTAYVWGSNWNTDNGTSNSYYTQLSRAASYTLTVSTSGTGSGTINITNNCQTGSFTSGTTIGPCTATPSGGSVFAGWTGTLGCTGTGTCTATITANSTMNAVFNLAPTSAPAAIQGTGSIQGTAVLQ